MKILLYLFIILAVPGTSTAAVNDTTKSKSLKVVVGTASYYGKRLEGAITATGEIFHHNLLMAASNNFKLNTWVRVTNLKNKKSIIVRINDRMHVQMAKIGRVVDLTRTAAIELDFIKRGLARVKVEEVPKGTPE
jgi:rare lipoprotein A